MKTILVVEDLQQTRHLICKKLWSNGYNTLDAASVQEAYEVLSHVTDQINLVLSDVDLPDINGFDLLKKIKNNPNLEDIPVVFWTSEYDSDKIRFARESGVARFVQKPFRDERFFTEIDRAINIKGAMINVVA
ncbi:MAG TPA: response regulator [Cyclobacteriaceae bacterium]